MVELFDGFDWDEANRVKCQKHGVSIAEIEALLSGSVNVFPDLAHSQAETRHLAIGCTPAGRHVFLAFTFRQIGLERRVRAISARYMHAKEVQHYETQIAPPSN